jgi:hypothetical protein
MSTSNGPGASFERVVQGRTELTVDTDLVPAKGHKQLLDLPTILEDLPGAESRARGRTTLWRWNPAWHHGTLVIRQFAHGGLLRHLGGTLFLSSRPMRRELRIARHARACGLRTCRPVALRLERVFGPFLEAHYVTEEIPHAPNLLQFCRDGRTGDLGAKERQELAREVSETLVQMHKAGIDHGDLNLKNLLILADQTPPHVAVIDFKKARLGPTVDLRKGLRNLVRLDRSVVKWSASRQQIHLTDRLRVLRHYLRLRSGADTDWKPTTRRIATRHTLHALSRR